MSEQSPASALDAKAMVRPGALQAQFVLDLLGRLLLVGAGLVGGALLGLIAGLVLGVIPISC